MINKNPLVSIVIPVYNGANYLREAIDSALAQTYQNVEIIVVNDGSNDDGATEQISLSYGDKIRYFHKNNGGVASALNLGISKMRGDYFSWLSHDDVYLTDKIEQQINIINDYNSDKLIVLCKNRYIDYQSKEILLKQKKSKMPINSIISGKEVVHYIFSEGTFCGCSLLIPKEAFSIAGNFDENLRFSQDTFMWAKIFLNDFDLVKIERIGVSSRIHNLQLSQTGNSIYHSNCEYMSNYFIPEFLTISSKENNLLLTYTLLNARMNNQNVVKRSLKSARGKKVFSFLQKTNIILVSIYGRIRPTIKKIYYKLFLKVKTK